jgi:predicted ATP-dependent serine protease
MDKRKTFQCVCCGEITTANHEPIRCYRCHAWDSFIEVFLLWDVSGAEYSVRSAGRF